MRYINKKRAVRALHALRGKTASGAAAGYYDHSRRSAWQQCPETGISNLLCDLRHLCDALGLDFAYLDSHSGNDYMFERD